jgi:hypothetical protein
MSYFIDFLIWAVKYGLWDIISVIVLLTSFIIAIRYIYLPRFKINNLNFFVKPIRTPGNFPLRIYFEIRNYTNTNVVLSTAYFTSKTLRPDPNARGDTPKKKYEMKFGEHKIDPDCLIKHGTNESTWVPIDQSHTDDEINKLIDKCMTGRFHCKCTILGNRPKTYRLVRKV